MTGSLTQLAEGGITLLIIIAVAIVSSTILTLLRKYDTSLKELFGNTPLMDEVIDSVSMFIQITVLEISEKVSEKYKDDGVITKEELAQIKAESVTIIVEKLNESQNSIIQSIYGDLNKWITEQVEKELDKLVESK